VLADLPSVCRAHLLVEISCAPGTIALLVGVQYQLRYHCLYYGSGGILVVQYSGTLLQYYRYCRIVVCHSRILEYKQVSIPLLETTTVQLLVVPVTGIVVSVRVAASFDIRFLRCFIIFLLPCDELFTFSSLVLCCACCCLRYVISHSHLTFSEH
jgi:hypothetical protein